MSTISSTIKDIIYYSPVRIIGIVLGFVSIAVYSRLFGPSEYGQYAIFISTLNLLYLFVNKWISQSALRFYSIEKQEKKLKNYFSALFLLSLSINLLSIIGIVVLIKPISNYLGLQTQLFALLAVVGPLGAFFNLFTQILRAEYKAKLYTKFVIANRVGGFFLGLLFFYLAGIKIEFIIWGMIGILLPLNIALFLQYKRYFSLNIIYSQFHLFKKYTKYGFPLLLSSGSVWLFSSSDRYILQYFRGANEVGLYSLSYNMASASLHVVFSMIIVAATPRIYNVFDESGALETQRLISSLTRVYFLVCTPMAVGISIVGHDLINVISGDKYITGGAVIPYVAFSLFFWGLVQYIAQKNNLFKTTHIDTIILSSSGLLNVGLNLIFIPKYGFKGAALTTLVSYIFYFIVAWFDANRKLPWIVPWNSLKKIAASSLIMGAVVLSLGRILAFTVAINLGVKVCVGILIYLCLLLLFKEIKSQEISILYYKVSQHD